MPPKKMKDSTISSDVKDTVSTTSETKKTATTTVKVNANDSDRLQLAQAINNLVVRGETFSAALEELANFSKQRLVDLDLKIESKKQEYQDLTAKLENQYKDTEIKLRQNLQESKLSAAKEVLADLNMVAVSQNEYNKLTDELEDIKASYTTNLTKAVQDERENSKKELQQAINNKTLAHTAEIASLKAQTEQQVKEIAVLKETISNLKHEIAEQRALTKEVAIAGSKGAIQQTIGNK